MLRDAPACLRRNRLVEMKKAAKAEATRKRLHSLLEAGECLDAATFPGIASALPTHALDAATDRSTAADADSASFDDADERRRELRRLFPGGTLYVDERPRVYPMSTDDDNLAPSHTSEPGEEKGTKPHSAGPVESPDGESPGGGVAGQTSTVVSGKRTTPENAGKRASAASDPTKAQPPRRRYRTSSRPGGFAASDSALSRGRDTGDSHRVRGTRAVRPRLRAELVRVTRGIHEQATLHQRDGPDEKVWYESTNGGAFVATTAGDERLPGCR